MSLSPLEHHRGHRTPDHNLFELDENHQEALDILKAHLGEPDEGDMRTIVIYTPEQITFTVAHLKNGGAEEYKFNIATKKADLVWQEKPKAHDHKIHLHDLHVPHIHMPSLSPRHHKDDEHDKI